MNTRIHLVVLALIWALSGKLAAQSGAAQTPKQIAEANKPGTVMIYTRWTSSARVARAQIRGAELIDFAENQAKLGLIPSSPSGMVRAMLDELIRHANTYLVPSSVVMNMQLETAGYGSGFIVTPDGYVVTSQHVVDASIPALKMAIRRTGNITN